MGRKMAGEKLKFYDNGHIYELDGIPIPSVSEILRYMSREVYGDINQYLLDQAAERGTEVHRATQQLDQTGECTIDCRWEGYLQAYARFLREHVVEWRYIEKPMAHRRLQYAGTLDRVGMLDGQMSVVDIKTNCAVKKALVKAQLNGYRLLCMANRIPKIRRLCCLQLLDTGKYRLYDVAIDPSEFKACLLLHNAMKKKHGRMRID